MKHFIVYDATTGAVLRAGTCADGDLALQARAGEGVIEATADAIVVAEMNLAPVKAWAATQLDANAEEVRAKYITIGSGQAMTYMAKNAEALAWLADSNAPTPFLSAEATAIGTTVAALVNEVRNQALAWQTIGAKIEAARRKAKVDIDAATNVLEVHAATQVDWTAALA